MNASQIFSKQHPRNAFSSFTGSHDYVRHKVAEKEHTRITLRFEISGKAIKVGTEWATPEVNERALLFVPVFKQNSGSCFWLKTAKPR